MGFLKRKLYTKPCHEGTLGVFEDPSTLVPYYGGGVNRDLVIYSGHLIVTMADIDTDTITISNLNAPNLLKYNNPTVHILCPDFGIPSLGQKFWLDLIDTINTEWTAKRITGVTVCCIGGHGRTGIALSILAGLTGACKSDPVSFIRKNYCESAVESTKQLNYIEEMTGIKVAADASKSYVSRGQSDFGWDHDYYGHGSFNDYEDKKDKKDNNPYGYEDKKINDLYDLHDI